MKPEARFRTNQVIPFLKTLVNTEFFPIQQKAIRGDADFFLCILGRFVWLELKATQGRESPLQKHKRQKVAEAGAVALIANPENWPEVKDYLRALSKGEKYESS